VHVTAQPDFKPKFSVELPCIYYAKEGDDTFDALQIFSMIIESLMMEKIVLSRRIYIWANNLEIFFRIKGIAPIFY
jgi:hypothetical protein